MKKKSLELKWNGRHRILISCRALMRIAAPPKHIRVPKNKIKPFAVSICLAPARKEREKKGRSREREKEGRHKSELSSESAASRRRSLRFEKSSLPPAYYAVKVQCTAASSSSSLSPHSSPEKLSHICEAAIRARSCSRLKKERRKEAFGSLPSQRKRRRSERALPKLLPSPREATLPPRSSSFSSTLHRGMTCEQMHITSPAGESFAKKKHHNRI